MMTAVPDDQLVSVQVLVLHCTVVLQTESESLSGQKYFSNNNSDSDSSIDKVVTKAPTGLVIGCHTTNSTTF